MTVAAILFSAAIAIAAYSLWPRGQKLNSNVAFYSDDDGQTYFKDSIYRLAPFDHNGKIADIAVVCTDGTRNFVGYLERYTPEARKQLQEVYDANPTAHYKTIDLMASPAISLKGMEVKLPGNENSWAPRSGMRPPDVQSPTGGEIQIVRP
jgi:hypothetical protein